MTFVQTGGPFSMPNTLIKPFCFGKIMELKIDWRLCTRHWGYSSEFRIKVDEFWIGVGMVTFSYAWVGMETLFVEV